MQNSKGLIKNERRQTNSPRLTKILFTQMAGWGGGETREERIEGEGDLVLAAFGNCIITLRSNGGEAFIRIDRTVAYQKEPRAAVSVGKLGQPDYVRKDGTCTSEPFDEEA